MRAWVGLLVLVACVGAAAPAAADDSELARARFVTGETLYQRGLWADALAEFEAAKRVMRSPAFDYNIAACLVKLGRKLEAATAFERFLASKPNDPDAAAIRAQIAELRRVDAPVVVRAPRPAAPPERDARRRLHTRLAIGLGAGGAALLVVGAALGGVALDRRSAYDRGCDAGRCNQSLYDGARASAIGADVMIPVGAALGVAAIALAATRPRAVEVRAQLGPGGAALALAGRF